MGILDGCSTTIFPMLCDVYYATESQDKYGEIEKTWQVDNARECYFYLIDNNSSDLLVDERFYEMNDMLQGRTKMDIRRSSTGVNYPITSILVSNIRSADLGNEIFYLDRDDPYETHSTVYSIRKFEPYVGPFNNIEHYKVLLKATDRQELEYA